MSLKLMYITNHPKVAAIAQKCGVDRIWVDLESKGKAERQRGMDTVKSQHKVNDIKILRPLITSSELLVRVNPWNRKSEAEIDAVIEAGADMVMLPMWKTADEVRAFVSTVRKRSKTILLLETREAENCLEQVLEISGIDELYIGLNDLHLAYGMTFMFELLANGTVERIAEKIKTAGLPYGFGGIARIGQGDLPAEKIVMEHYRMNSACVILSRSFCHVKQVSDYHALERLFFQEITKLRCFEEYVRGCPEEFLKANQEEVVRIVSTIADKKHRR